MLHSSWNTQVVGHDQPCWPWCAITAWDVPKWASVQYMKMSQGKGWISRCVLCTSTLLFTQRPLTSRASEINHSHLWFPWVPGGSYMTGWETGNGETSHPGTSGACSHALPVIWWAGTINQTTGTARRVGREVRLTYRYGTSYPQWLARSPPHKTV